jgi:hypothetical protein
MPRRRRTIEERERLIDRQIEQERAAEAQRFAEAADPVKYRALPLRSGDKNAIEEDTNKLIADDRRANPHTETDILSGEQYMLRRSREVFNINGVPDASLVSGLYRRAYNPQYGQRPSGKKSADDG